VPPVQMPDDPQERAKNQADLVAQWKEAASALGSENMDWSACGAIVKNLRQFGPEALLPLVDVLADKDQTPHAKVAATNCLADFVHPVMIEPLKAMIEPGLDQTTRACATHLLGHLLDPTLEPVLRKLSTDPEQRVRFAALLGLLRRGDPAARQELGASLDDPETAVAEREEIGRVLVMDARRERENVPLLMKTVQDFELDASVRRMAVGALGRADDPTAIAALEVTAKQDPDELVREIAANAAEAIRARQKVRQERRAAQPGS